MTTDHTPPVTGYPAPPLPNGYAHPFPAHPQPPPPNGYAHPYPAHPLPPPPPYPNHHRSTFLRHISAVIIGTFIITGTIVFTMWLVLRPHLPTFHLQTLTLTNFNITSNSMISGTWTTIFTVRNPNSKITLHYDHIQAAVFHKSKSIAVTNVAPLVSVSEYFDGNWIGRERGKEKGVVGFSLRLVGRVRFKAGGWWTRRRVLRVYCPGLGVRVEGNGTGGLMGGGKECRVRV